MARSKGTAMQSPGRQRPNMPRGPIPAAAKAQGQAGVYRNDKTSAFGPIKGVGRS